MAGPGAEGGALPPRTQKRSCRGETGAKGHENMAMLVLYPSSVPSQRVTAVSPNQILRRCQLPPLRMQSFALEQPPQHVPEQRGRAETTLDTGDGAPTGRVASGHP